MGNYIMIGGIVIVTLGLISDANGTVKLVTVIITVKGISFIVRKIADSFSKDYGDMINFVGNCIAGVSCVGLIRNAKMGVQPVMNVLGKLGSTVQNFSVWLDGLSEFINSVSIWN